jgi:hypothetical protein
MAELSSGLPGLFSAIEHVGSTAVPGLAAKPIIDLMAATDDLDLLSRGTRSCAGWGTSSTTPECLAGCSTAAALLTPPHTTCTLSRPAPSQPGISDCCATTCAATQTTWPDTRL